jgi:hypothetical protein
LDLRLHSCFTDLKARSVARTMSGECWKVVKDVNPRQSLKSV